MGDINDGDVLRFEVLDDAEQGLYLVGGQGGGRLVQDQHPAIGGNRLGDFDALHLADAELAYLLVGVKAHADLLEQGGSIFVHLFVIDDGDKAEQLLQRIPAQENILADGPRGNRLQFLVNHGDALLQGVHGVADGDRLAVDLDLPFIHFIDAEHTLHQGGFAGAVFSHQRVHFPGAQLQLYVIQRLDTRKGLADIRHFQHVFGHTGFISFQLQ